MGSTPTPRAMRNIDWITYKDDSSRKIEVADIKLVTMDKNGRIIPNDPNDPNCSELSILCSNIVLTQDARYMNGLYVGRSMIPGLIIDVDKYCWMASDKRAFRQPGIRLQDLPWITIGDRNYFLKLAGIEL